MADRPPHFGDWLSRARRTRRVSQQRLADVTGIDRGYLSRIENRKVELPTYETRQRIHAALGTSEEELRVLGIVPTRHVTVHDAGTIRRDATGSVRTGRAVAESEPSYVTDDNASRIAAVTANWSERQIDLLWRYIDGINAALDERGAGEDTDAPPERRAIGE